MIDIPLGATLKRSEIHDTYGGNRQFGICNLSKEPAVLLFSYPHKKEHHGYTDGWGEDGFFHYNGEGQIGDQIMTRGNHAILHHAQTGRSLHLFVSPKKSMVRYLGQFALSTTDPWYSVDALDTKQEMRRAIIFRLQPVEKTLPHSASPPKIPAAELGTAYLPLEKHVAERLRIHPSATAYEAERREGALVHHLREHLENRGHKIGRHKLRPPGEAHHIYTDLYDETDNLLVEAKGSVSREAIRMAVGQLFDYRRHLTQEPKLAVLVPEQPRKDLIDLCASVNIAVMWPEDKGFYTHQP